MLIDNKHKAPVFEPNPLEKEKRENGESDTYEVQTNPLQKGKREKGESDTYEFCLCRHLTSLPTSNCFTLRL